jgi:NAD(P)-dependent dehydrogenase (short-subunit alcohol dehydrogenase family)
MTERERPLEGKVAIVTGAGSTIGLGHAMTLALVEAGARVAMVDIDERSLAQSAAEARGIGGHGSVVPITCDVTKPEEPERAVEKTLGELGGLHILVNNAGINPRPAPTDSNNQWWHVASDTWSRVITTNLNGAFFMSKAVVPHMIGQGWGRIIVVTTSLDMMYRSAPYGPSKAGLEAFATVMADSLEGTGVTVNILVPGGGTNTNFLPPDTPIERRQAMIQPEVMRAPVVWMASEASRSLNSRRIIAYYWDENVPIEERLEKSCAPAAWPQLGRQTVIPGSTSPR